MSFPSQNFIKQCIANNLKCWNIFLNICIINIYLNITIFTYYHKMIYWILNDAFVFYHWSPQGLLAQHKFFDGWILEVGLAAWGRREVWEPAVSTSCMAKRRPFPAQQQKMKAYPAGWQRHQVTRATWRVKPNVP